jgi:hypothetical protein
LAKSELTLSSNSGFLPLARRFSETLCRVVFYYEISPFIEEAGAVLGEETGEAQDGEVAEVAA